MLLLQSEIQLKIKQTSLGIMEGGAKIWIHLAGIYSFFGDEDRALKVLKVGSEIDTNEWSIWDVLMKQSLVTKNYDQMVRCYDRLLDLRDKYENEEALSFFYDLVKATKEDRPELKDLLEKMKGLDLMTPLSWLLMLRVSLWNTQALTETDLNKCELMLSHCHKMSFAQKGWINHFDSVKSVINFTIYLSDAYSDFLPAFNNSEQIVRLFTSVIESISSVVDAIRAKHTNILTSDIRSEFKEPIDQLEYLIGSYQHKLDVFRTHQIKCL